MLLNLNELVLLCCLGYLLCLSNSASGKFARVSHYSYKMFVELQSYLSERSVTQDDVNCDVWAFNRGHCDVQFTLSVQCTFCIPPSAVVYPKTGQCYQNAARIGTKDFRKVNAAKLYFQDWQDKMQVGAKVLDFDVKSHQLVFNGSFTLVPSKYAMNRWHTIDFGFGKNPDRHLLATFMYTCNSKRCGAYCQFPNDYAICNGTEPICTTAQVQGMCKLFRGNVTNRISLLHYEIVTKMCVESVFVCMKMKNRSCAASDWQMIARIGSGVSVNASLDFDGSFEMYEFYRELQLESVEEQSIVVRVDSQCDSQSSSALHESPYKFVHSAHSQVFRHERFSGVVRTDCKAGYEGPYCQTTCARCTKETTTVCAESNRTGTTCLYRKLCASLHCLHGKCVLGQGKARCLCSRGYFGARCELQNGTNCENHLCNAREQCLVRFDELVGSFQPVCVCKAPYRGPACDVCVNATDILCRAISGHFAIVVELESMRLLSDELQEMLQLHTEVVVCVDSDCQLVASWSGNTFVDNRRPREDAWLVLFEKNLTALPKSSEFNVEMRVTRWQPGPNMTLPRDGFNVGALVKHFFDSASPQSYKVGLHDEAKYISAMLTVRCARGYNGPSCNDNDNHVCALNEYTQKVSFRATTSRDNCWPQSAYVCTSGTAVGPSCMLQKWCANVSCTPDSLCTIANELTSAQCLTADLLN